MGSITDVGNLRGIFTGDGVSGSRWYRRGVNGSNNDWSDGTSGGGIKTWNEIWVTKADTRLFNEYWLMYTKQVSQYDCDSLLEDPYQILKPKKSVVYFIPDQEELMSFERTRNGGRLLSRECDGNISRNDF